MATRLTLEEANALAEQKRQNDQLAFQQELAQKQALAELSQQSQAQKLQAAIGADFYGGGSGGTLATKSSGNPLIDAFQQYQNQESATNPWNIGARALRQVALPKSDNFWENLLGAGTQGLLTGGLSQLGENDVNTGFREDLMPTLGKLYPQLQDSLGTSPTIDAGKMALIAAIGDSAHQNKLEELGIKAKGNSSNLPFMEGLEGIDKSPEATYGAETRKIAQQISGQQIPPAAAMEEAGRLMRSKREQQDRNYKSVEESQQKSGDLLTYADEIDKAVAQAGTTGFYGKPAQTLAGLLSGVSSEQEGKYTGGQNLQKFGVEAIKEFGPAFKGPMSDKDVEIMLSKIPGVDKTTEFNLAYSKKLRAVAAVNQAYSDYMYEMRDSGVPAYEANRRFELFKRKNPLVENGDINPDWLSGQAFEVLKQSPSSSIGSVDTPTRNVPQGTNKPDIRTRLKQIRGG